MVYVQSRYCRLNGGLCRLASGVITSGSVRSKIYISIVYLWTGRGPEINNGPSVATPLNGMTTLPGTGAYPADGSSEGSGGCGGRR